MLLRTAYGRGENPDVESKNDPQREIAAGTVKALPMPSDVNVHTMSNMITNRRWIRNLVFYLFRRKPDGHCSVLLGVVPEI